MRRSGIFIIGILFINACAPVIIEQPLTPAHTEEKQLPSVIIEGVSENISSSSGLTALYEAVNPGVVSITVYKDLNIIGQGSGFLFNTDGYILTNYHVVLNAQIIEIAFPNGYRTIGELVGKDLDSDIAVIKTEISGQGIKPLVLGSSKDVKVGQQVVAIGNPYGLSGTMTVGIVSARGRLIDSLRSSPSGGYFTSSDLIQTDAAINPGNSGGPLLNMNGEVIGINRAIRTNDGSDGILSNSGIGFAVPIDIVNRVVPFLILEGKYEYPYLGIVSRENLTLFEKEALGFSNDINGAYVVDVAENGPAADAGLQGGSGLSEFTDLPPGGDLITEIDGNPIRNFSDLLAYLVTYTSPGDEVAVTLIRDGEELILPVTLSKRPD